MSSGSRHTGREEKKRRVPAVGSRKVVVDFPEPLFEQTERAAAELAINRSALIRSAVERYLEALHRKRLEEELAAGYVANAELDRRIAAEFSSVDYETF
jgi:metal-responsive CopG/Arc/MetJ family transcriptional regulator